MVITQGKNGVRFAVAFWLLVFLTSCSHSNSPTQSPTQTQTGILGVWNAESDFDTSATVTGNPPAHTSITLNGTNSATVTQTLPVLGTPAQRLTHTATAATITTDTTVFLVWKTAGEFFSGSPDVTWNASLTLKGNTLVGWEGTKGSSGNIMWYCTFKR